MENLRHFVIILSAGIFHVASGSNQAISRKFTASEACGLQEQIDNGCVQQLKGVRSLVECFTLCREGCTQVLVGDPGTCYVANQCYIETSTCDVNDTMVRLYEKSKPCQHGGLWNSTSEICKCYDGWVGQRCERLPKNCSELRDYGYPTGWRTGYHWVSLDLDNYPTPVRVRCDMWDPFENTMLASSYGVFSNNKTWSQYLDGFIHDNDSFWLGLDKMYALNKIGLTKLIIQAGFLDKNNKHNLLQRTHFNFQLNPSAGFTFTFSHSTERTIGPVPSTMNFRDCLRPVEGSKFSTFDHDEDDVPAENCAAQAGVGWWFKDCDNVCNPLGWSYETKPGSETESHVKFGSIDFSRTNSFKQVEVYIYFQTN